MADRNSFETVELLKPISLIQIDGSEPKDVKDEAKDVQVPEKAECIVAENTVTVRENTDVNTKTDVETPVDNGVEKILVDPEKLLGNQDFGEKQDYQKHNYAARFIIICLIGICLIFTLIMIRSFKDSDKHTVAESNYNPILVSHSADVDRYIYSGGVGLIDVPDYTEMDFDADEIDADLPVIINHRCVEYTDSYYRILFFTATATEEDVGLMIDVEMFDRNGRSLGVSSSGNSDVAAGNEFMIVVSFDISPNLDLSGATYKIKARTYKERKEALRRKITDVTEAEKGHFLITCEGTAYSSVVPYVTLYKNGKVVGILKGYGDFDENGKVVVDVYKTEIDYDTYKVFY